MAVVAVFCFPYFVCSFLSSSGSSGSSCSIPVIRSGIVVGPECGTGRGLERPRLEPTLELDATGVADAASSNQCRRLRAARFVLTLRKFHLDR